MSTKAILIDWPEGVHWPDSGRDKTIELPDDPPPTLRLPYWDGAGYGNTFYTLAEIRPDGVAVYRSTVPS